MNWMYIGHPLTSGKWIYEHEELLDFLQCLCNQLNEEKLQTIQIF